MGGNIQPRCVARPTRKHWLAAIGSGGRLCSRGDTAGAKHWLADADGRRSCSVATAPPYVQKQMTTAMRRCIPGGGLVTASSRWSCRGTFHPFCGRITGPVGERLGGWGISMQESGRSQGPAAAPVSGSEPAITDPRSSGFLSALARKGSQPSK